jgi:hypothetical protein
VVHAFRQVQPARAEIQAPAKIARTCAEETARLSNSGRPLSYAAVQTLAAIYSHLVVFSRAPTQYVLAGFCGVSIASLQSRLETLRRRGFLGRRTELTPAALEILGVDEPRVTVAAVHRS